MPVGDYPTTLSGLVITKAKDYQDKGSEDDNEGFLGTRLSRHHGVRLNHPCPSGIDFFLYSEEGSLGGLEADLKLTILLSCLGIMVLGSPPLLEEAPGIIIGVRVKGVQRRV